MARLSYVAAGLAAIIVLTLGILFAAPGPSSTSSSTHDSGLTTSTSSSSTPNSPSPSSSTSSQSVSSIPTSCHERDGEPDAACTPGATDPRVTQDNIQSTICVSGYTTTVRPPVSYTNQLKIQQIAQYGYGDTNPSDYEEDHLIALEIGGNPTSPLNLWPQPHYGTYTATEKDSFENYLHAHVCSGAITLAEAQHEIATDWVRYWMAAGSP